LFKFEELKKIHIEITNNCQASCPMCSRNVNGGLSNPLIKNQNWSLDDFKHIMSSEVLEQITSYYFCGNFGDPILNNELISMCQYSNEIAPDVYISIYTNGSARDIKWWINLAQSLPKKHRVVFALDGLSDTHSIYRIGTNFEKIIENASAFISAGGNAEWAFIKFKHNQHQVEEAKELSKKIGFNTFQVKHSTRFIGEPKLDVLDKEGKFKYFIEPSDDDNLKYIDNSIIDNYKHIVKNSNIDCIVKKNKSIYIDHLGDVYPCCWIASSPFTYHNLNDGVRSIRIEIDKEYQKIIDRLGSKDQINANARSLIDIINDDRWQLVWENIWKEKASITCARTCGNVNKKFSQPKDQFSERYVFNEHI